MEIDAPTFQALNKPQKRALILRDQLRYKDAHHLNTFIDGMTDDEPPTYTKINGKIQPALTLVTLKDTATRFDLGNVMFPEENNAVHRVCLIVQDGQIEMRTEQALPRDEANLDSVPIHGFIAGTMVPMFKDKFQAIFARMQKINEARKASYKMPIMTSTQIYEGETLARLDPSNADKSEEAQLKKLKKREPNEVVVPHIANKHKLNGLDTIPEDAKRQTFDTIPSHVKVDLFNSIVRTAFPNFDNLMIASWNVVAIYSACGSDFPELHKAIVDLKGVLQDFDETFGRRVDRATPSYRHDFAGSSHGSVNGDRSRLPSSSSQLGVANALRKAGSSSASGLAQQVDDADNNPKERGDKAQLGMYPPPTLQAARHSEDLEAAEANVMGEQDLPLNHRLSGQFDHRPSSHSTPDSHMTGSVPHSTNASPAPPRTQLSSNYIESERGQSGDRSIEEEDPDAIPATNPELARRREEYASSIGKSSPMPEAKTSTAYTSAIKRLFKEDEDEDEDANTNSPSEKIETPKQMQIRPAQSPTTTPTPKRKKTIADYTTAQLRQKYHDRKSQLLRTFGGMASVPAQHTLQLQQLEAAFRAKEREDAVAVAVAGEQGDGEKRGSGNEKRSGSRDVKRGGGGGMFGNYNGMGNSVLGARKTGSGGGGGGAGSGGGSGTVPVANMFPPSAGAGRKDGGTGPRDG